MSHIEGETSFFSEWAALRAMINSGQLPGAHELALLEEKAMEPRESVLIGAIEIEAGQRKDDSAMLAAGLTRLRTGTADEQLELLAALSDLTILGSPPRRADLLRDLWREQLGDDHDGVKVLQRGDKDAANRLIADGEMSTLRSLPSNLSQELRRQVAWKALELWTLGRYPVWWELLKSPVVELTADEASNWEYELIRAIASAAQGYLDDAIARIQRLISGPAAAGWKRRQLARSMTTYAFLAAPGTKTWLEAMPEAPFPPHESTSPVEELGSSLCISLREPRQHKKALRAAVPHLETRASIAFLMFLELAELPHGAVIGQLLLRHLADNPDSVRRLPWPNREAAFARACLLTDPAVGIPLLAHAADGLASRRLAAELATALDSASSESLGKLPRGTLAELLTEHATQLSAGSRAMLSRQLVYRAVIDGSNVCLAGTSHGNRKGSLRYYEQAVHELEEAGFREILTFFDATTRHRVPGGDWAQVESLVAERRAVVVRGVADPYIIRCFLEAPESTWVVTADDYRDHLTEFPELRPYWFKHRLSFHVDHNDQIAWERSMESSTLPKGAPQQPRES